MFGLRTASVALSVALASSAALAQVPTPTVPVTPAATLGRIVPVEGNEPVSPRGQMPDAPPTIIYARSPGMPVGATTPPPGTLIAQGQPGGTPVLPPPRPLTGGPGVTELRGPGGTPGATMMPPQQFGAPIYGIPGGIAPQPIMTDHHLGSCPPGSPYPVNPGPVYGSPTPAPTPIYGGAVPGSPYPVTPATPTVSPDGFVGGPTLVDPYLGPNSPLFPRVRGAISGVRTPFAGRLTLEADYLLWFIKAGSSPPLVTTSSPANNGIIGQGDTRVLFGEQVLGNTRFSGGRFGAVYWLGNSNWGLDSNIFFLGRNGGNFTATSLENPVLARPFVRADTGQQFSELVAFPGLANGSVAVEFATEMNGADVSLRRPLFCGPCSRLDFLIGYRYAGLIESLQVTESFFRTPQGLQVGNSNIAGGTVVDRFRTENRFHGVNLGLAGELRRGRYFGAFKGSVGLGSIYQTLDVSGGQNLLTTTGGVTNAVGGLLALPGANIGTFTQRKYGVVPEANLTLGVYLTPNLRFGVGYSLLYMNSVIRPGDQIDPVVDATRIPNFPLDPPATAVNPPRPRAWPLRTTDIFAQGITFSLQWTW